MSVSARILSFEQRQEDKRYTVFKMRVTINEQTFVIFKRYSEFREMLEQLKAIFPKETSKLKLPSKRLLGNNFDPEFLESRLRGLQDFLDQLITLPGIGQERIVTEWLAGRRVIARAASDEPIDIDVENEVQTAEDDPTRVDLGSSEDKRASINDFTLLKVIGKGSFGRVLLARHEAKGKNFAIKVLNKDAIIRQNEVKHIKAERNVLIKNFKHPFLVGLHYSFQTRGKLYFVLDYVNGGELFFHLQKEKKFSIIRSRFYAAELTSALGYLHSLDVVYRDLKPENILLTSQGHVILTDFGLCKENVKPGETTGTFCGTPEYLAPEVLKKHSYGRPVDWWCLGCVTYEMMCGLPPFYSRDCAEMYDRILNDKLRFPEHVPPVARQWLEAILDRRPERRLGGSEADAEEVKSHPFFGDIDWEKLERKEIKPPWTPNVSDAFDLKNFDPEFTAEPIPMSVQVSTPHDQEVARQSMAQQDDFDGFSYVGDGIGQIPQ